MITTLFVVMGTQCMSGNYHSISSQRKVRLYGRAATDYVGLPFELANQIAEYIHHTFNTAIAIRCNSAFQFLAVPSAPKSIAIKAKTGTWGLTKGVIPADATLGKYNRHNVPVNQHYRKPDHVILIQHKIKLRDILSGLTSTPPKYELSSSELESHVLLIKPLLDREECAPASTDIIYCIKLDEKTPILINNPYVNDELILSKPSWWNDTWGDYATLFHSYFPLYYQQGLDKSTRKPVEIYAIKQASNEIKSLLPITRDFDLLWVAQPHHQIEFITQFAVEHHIQLHDVIDTHRYKPTKKLLQNLNALVRQYDPNHIWELTLSDLTNLGTVTPFEILIIHMMNLQTEKFSKHTGNLFQHGAENRNPDKLSDINGNILHFWKGQIILTRDETDLVNFLLNEPNFLNENSIAIHPGWNKSLWVPVNEKQRNIILFPHIVDNLLDEKTLIK